MKFIWQAARFLGRHFLPSRLLEVIRVYRRLSLVTESPELIEVPPGQRVLVLSPHMDDEVIGCGGTIAKHTEKGCVVAVSIITDGSLGDPVLERTTLSEEHRKREKHILTEVRKKESRAAAKCLGVQDVFFFDFKDGNLAEEPGAREAVAGLVDEFRPDLLYAPFITDGHPDHRALSDIVTSLSLNWPDLMVAGYEVWSPLHANCIVDITAQIDRKIESLNCFPSQLKHNNYLHTALGLNAFRSMHHMQGRGFAEAFFVAPAHVYAAVSSAVGKPCG